jgi:hypothetical protein
MTLKLFLILIAAVGAVLYMRSQRANLTTSGSSGQGDSGTKGPKGIGLCV